jgi:hypothetical protein
MYQYRVGDKIVCVGGFVNNDNDVNGGGHGYEEGKVLTIYGVNPPITNSMFGGIHKDEYVVFGYDEYGNDCGVWSHSIKLGNGITPRRYIKKLHLV